MLWYGSMFVGGSLPVAEVPTDKTASDYVPGWPNRSTLLLDHSYLANQALFDSYFFSTVPPTGTAPSGTVWPKQWLDFNNANPGVDLKDASIPLLNNRITPLHTNGQAPAMADLRDMDKAASNLVLNGAFNVNSTSVDAWRALLSSLSGKNLSLWDATTETSKTFTSSELLNPISRFWSSNGGGAVNTLWSGVRALTDPQIQALATEIVLQVKRRGPFLSMADFLNRRLGANTLEFSRAGCLQAAIDRTNINDSVKNAGVSHTITAASITPAGTNVTIKPPPILGNLVDATGTAWNTTIGAPGYLMQQDVVQAFSPVLTARSDTFMIRTYGEVANPATSQAVSKAWLEAVVQRLPEFVVPSDPAETPLTSINSDNQKLGRRFKVISMRWLSPNEI